MSIRRYCTADLESGGKVLLRSVGEKLVLDVVDELEERVGLVVTAEEAAKIGAAFARAAGERTTVDRSGGDRFFF